MSILDDAIREHLELKRAHGADESELKKLEDEAFGPPERPGEVDPLAEAPTEFLGAPAADAGGGAEAPFPDAPTGRREPNIADLQEPPEPAPEAEAARPEPADEPAPPSGPNTQERHAIAEQPTELFDVESAIDSEADAPSDAPAPSDDDLLDAEQAEPPMAPVDPLSGIEASAAEAEAAEEPLLEDEEEEDDFFSEQRLSDELNQALETPQPGEPQLEPRADEELEEEVEEPAASDEAESAEHEDVLEETPDFLEDAPEDDDLWFEQRPPKDFDFDD